MEGKGLKVPEYLANQSSCEYCK